MSCLPKRDKLASVQASAIDVAAAQEGNFYIKGEAGTGEMGGPCYRIAAVVDGLLCGLVGKIVARLEENCKRLLGDEFDRAGVEVLAVDAARYSAASGLGLF